MGCCKMRNICVFFFLNIHKQTTSIGDKRKVYFWLVHNSERSNGQLIYEKEVVADFMILYRTLYTENAFIVYFCLLYVAEAATCS